eukprot:TRINITY_DN33847_c0_g1_i1.p1 TRINITY_DN33847_c0_g1~~TRINITY_DN33847_c0_g1_i1.p1  ORF type:complete len:149 (+),score=38.28 TRINITY_DN33847_c0_g1_i1:60-449(+)
MLRSLVGSEMCIRDSSAATTPQIAPSPTQRQPSVVVLDDDDDLDMSPSAKPPILLDDDSDDELLPSAAKTGPSADRPRSPQASSVVNLSDSCLLYTSDAADEEDSVDLGGRRIIKKKTKQTKIKRIELY